jgi:hypothetical protein
MASRVCADTKKAPADAGASRYEHLHPQTPLGDIRSRRFSPGGFLPLNASKRGLEGGQGLEKPN